MFTAVYNRLLAPWNVAYLFVPLWFAPTISILLGLFMCQLGMYCLSRRLGLGTGGAVFAAIAYTFSGTVVASLLRIHEMLLFPLLLYAIHGAVTAERKRARYLLLACAATAFTLVAGFPEVAVMSVGFGGLWWAYLSFRALRLRGNASLRRTIEAAVAMAAGGAISLIQLLPSLEYLRATGSLERSIGEDTILQHLMLGTSVSGRLFGNPGYPAPWAASRVTNGFEGNSTIGLVVIGLLLAVFLGWSSARRGTDADRHLSRFLLPAALFVLLAVYWGGPFGWLVHHLPFGKVIVFPRMRFIIPLVLAITAAGGLEGIRMGRGGGTPSVAQRLFAGTILAAIGVGFLDAAGFASSVRHVKPFLSGLVLPVAIAIPALLLAFVAKKRGIGTVACVLAAAVELQWGLWQYTPASPREHFYTNVSSYDAIRTEAGHTGLYRFVGLGLSTARPNTSAVVDLNDLRTAFPALTRYTELLNTAEPGVYKSTFKSPFTAALDPDSRILDALAARYYILGAGSIPLQTGDQTVAPAPKDA